MGLFDFLFEDEFTKMIKSSYFNPFNITLDKRLEPAVNLPNMRDIFANELNSAYAKSLVMDINKKTIIDGYMFNLVESYYNNAGYVPKKALDQMLKQVFDAIQRTPLKNTYSSLEDFKYNCYYSYLHK